MKGAPAAPSPRAPPASPGPASAKVPRIPPAVLQGIGIRVSVVGTRGKSTLAAWVAAALRRRNIVAHCNAPRSAAPPVRDTRSAWERQAEVLGMAVGDRHLVEEATAQLHAAWPVQALVLANRARSAAGMRRLHAEVCMPHYVLVTNVRRDPGGIALRPLPAEARRLVRGITPGALVLLGDPDPAVRALLRRECERAGLVVLDAAPPRPTPGAELVSLLDALLLHRLGKGLDPDEEFALRKELEARFRWQPSSLPGVRWFEGGSLHDVDTVQIALNHLQARRRLPVTFVAYLRADRPGRTRAYAAFLEELLMAPDTRQVVLCGHRAAALAERLDRWGTQVRVVPDDVSSVPRLVRRLQFDCQGGAIVTLANDEGPWAEELARQLHKGSAQAPPQAAAPRPTRDEAAFSKATVVPRRIVRPMVAAAPVPSAQLPFVQPPFVAMPPAAPAASAAPAAASSAAPLTAAAVAAVALPSALPSLARPALPKADAIH